MKRVHVACIASGALFAAACGSSPPPAPAAPPAETASPESAGPRMVVQQELGSIDDRAVDETFAKLEGALDACHDGGRARVPYLTGDVKVYLRIDTSGRVKYGFFEDSSLGDRDTEKCILDAFKAASWPKPEGGEAEVRHSFGWTAGGERAPVSWDPGKVTGALDEAGAVKKDVAACKKGVKGEFKITAYVEPAPDDAEGEAPSSSSSPPPKTKKKGGKPAAAPAKKSENHGGKFLAIGVVPPNREAADKADCIVDALRPLSLPTPGSYAAKVSFSL